MTKLIAKGNLTSGSAVEGTLRTANSIDEVFKLLSTRDLEDVILLVDAASVTLVAPLMPRIRGIICRTGGATSHLALVAREFALSCVMGAMFAKSGAEQAVLQGQRIAIAADGSIQTV